MTILNSLIVPKNLKEGTLLDCLISIMLQKFLKIEGGPFRDIKKIREKNEKSKKILASLIVPKNLKGETL